MPGGSELLTGPQEGASGRPAPQSSARGGSSSEHICMAVGQSHLLAGCWQEACLSSWPCVPPPTNMAAGFSQSKHGGEQESMRDGQKDGSHRHFPNLRRDIHHFCCILFVRSKSGPVCTGGEWMTGRPESREFREGGNPLSQRHF